MSLDNLNDPVIRQMQRDIKALQTQAGLGNSSTSKGQTQFKGTESVLISGSGSVSGTLTVGGTEIVNGTLYVHGHLVVDTGDASFTGPVTIAGAVTSTGAFSVAGAFTITGPSNFVGNITATGTVNATGTVTFTGPFNMNGATVLNGTLAVNGVTTVNADLNVGSSGKITVGSLVLQPGGTYGGVIGTTGVVIAMNAASVLMSGDLSVTNIVSNGDLSLFGGITAFGVPNTTASANLVIDSGGVFKKSTSARRFKIKPRLVKELGGLLDVRFKDWTDKGDPDGPRIPGVIAEEVAAVPGGGLFVGRDDKGRIESVMYDRLALATAHAVNQKLDAEVKALRAELAELRKLITK